MGMVKMQKREKAVVVRTPRDKTPRAHLLKSGPNGCILVLLRDALEKTKLEVNNGVDVAFDAATGCLGIRKNDRSQFVLRPHGNSEKRLKVTVTDLRRDYFPDLPLDAKNLVILDEKTKAEPGVPSYWQIKVLEVAPPAKKRGRPRKDASVSASTEAVKTNEGGSDSAGG